MKHSSAVTGVDRRVFLRGTLGLLGAASASGLLAACDTGQEASEVATEAGTAGLAIRSFYFNQDPNNAVMRGAISRFTEANEGAVVEATGVNFGEYLDQTILAARQNNLTGLLHIDFSWLAALNELDLFRPIEDELDGYTESGLAIGNLDGTQLGLPLTVANIGMVANTQILDQAGVSDIPKTIDEFVNALDQVRSFDPGIMAYGLGTVAGDGKHYIPWMWQFGSDVMVGRDVSIGDEESVRALEWCKELLDEGFILPDNRLNDARAQFGQGRVAFYEDAIVARQTAVTVSGNEDYYDWTVPVPRPGLQEGDRPRSTLWGNIMCVVDDEAADEHLELARFMTSDPEAALELFEGLGLAPSTRDNLQLDPIASDEYTQVWTEEMTAFADPSPFTAFPEVLELEVVLGEAVESVYFSGVPAAEALGQAAAQIEDLIA